MKPSLKPPQNVPKRLVPHIPQTMRYYRQIRRLSQAELAKLSGLSLSAIKWLERGRKNACRIDTLEAVCEGLGVGLLTFLATTTEIANGHLLSA